MEGSTVGNIITADIIMIITGEIMMIITARGNHDDWEEIIITEEITMIAMKKKHI